MCLNMDGVSATEHPHYNDCIILIYCYREFQPQSSMTGNKGDFNKYCEIPLLKTT